VTGINIATSVLNFGTNMLTVSGEVIKGQEQANGTLKT
jgi:hypothetical protein